ncbi:hypothetical protein LCGC14_2927570, partial [marine sediment metagenome]
MLRAKYIRNAPDGNGTLFRGDIYQVPINGLLGGNTGQRIWETNLVAQYSLGTRLITEDGRVFRYAKATNIVSVKHFGLKFWNQIGDGIAANAGGSSAIGEYTVTLTGTATKDEYKGGYLIVFSSPVQFRAIVGNTATSGTTFVVTLAEPLTVAVTGASTYCEALQSPYANVRLTAGPSGGQSGNEWSSVAGLPYTITSVANSYLWIQTWGPVWINPAGVSLNDAGVAVNERQLVFDFEGSVIIVGDATATTVSMQHAGFIIDRNYESTS